MGGTGSVDYVVQPRPWEPGEVFGRWAAEREAEGWAGVGVGDHWFLEGSGGCANAFVQLGHAAASTRSIGLSTSFANNLFRSPVELAQAALTIQLLSGGRFELGIGAGWSADELTGAGLAFPDPAVRVRRLREAVRVVRDLLHGACRFAGEFYDVDLPAVGPPGECRHRHRISASLGGPVAMRTIGPLVDRIEAVLQWVPPSAMASPEHHGPTFNGSSTSPGRPTRPHPVTLALVVAPGTGPAVDYFRSLYEASCFDGLAGRWTESPTRSKPSATSTSTGSMSCHSIGGVAELAAHLLEPNH